MLTDSQIRSYLEDHYKIASGLAGLEPKTNAIKLMVNQLPQIKSLNL